MGRGLERGPDPTAAAGAGGLQPCINTECCVCAVCAQGEPAGLLLCLVLALPGPWAELG